MNMNHLLSIIKEISPNKVVLDLACHDGWAGNYSLKNNASFVKFADARTEYISPSKAYSNYSKSFIDLNYPNDYKNILSDCDIVLYFGHFYHCNNHDEIIEFLLSGQATEFVLESKTYPDEVSTPDIEYHYEYTKDKYSAYSKTKSKTIIGKPNIVWTENLLLSKNLKIKKINKQIQNHFNGEVFLSYWIHFSK